MPKEKGKGNRGKKSQPQIKLALYLDYDACPRKLIENIQAQYGKVISNETAVNLGKREQSLKLVLELGECKFKNTGMCQKLCEFCPYDLSKQYAEQLSEQLGEGTGIPDPSLLEKVEANEALIGQCKKCLHKNNKCKK